MQKEQRLARTSITIPLSLKKKMEQSGENWSQLIREMIAKRIEEDSGADMTEAVILNEKIRRPAPKGFSSLRVIKAWRRAQ
jgi:hypothetical protein